MRRARSADHVAVHKTAVALSDEARFGPRGDPRGGPRGGGPGRQPNELERVYEAWAEHELRRPDVAAPPPRLSSMARGTRGYAHTRGTKAPPTRPGLLDDPRGAAISPPWLPEDEDEDEDAAVAPESASVWMDLHHPPPPPPERSPTRLSTVVETAWGPHGAWPPTHF